VSWLQFREPVSSWTHCAWLLLALPATLLLWRAGRGDRLKQVGFLVFGLGLTACYAGSTLYHAVRLPERQIAWFVTLDFIGVYLLIAGTITPLAVVVLRGRWRWGLLTSTWLLAGGGIGLRLASAPMSRLISTAVYLGMGWAVLLASVELLRVLSRRAVRPALLGGLLYSTGAVLNHVDWPPLWPGVFSAHELFHLFVMGGSLSHFWFMLTVVAPFERQQAAEEVDRAEPVGDPRSGPPNRTYALSPRCSPGPPAGGGRPFSCSALAVRARRITSLTG
jgi:hemolysin III